MKRPDTRLLGKWGEAETARYLREKGYTIVAAGYYTRFGEMDIIASDGRYLAFVEVKLRKSAAFAAPREFVDARKQGKLRACAEQYLADHPTALQPRFDVAEVYAPHGITAAKPEIQYFENAF